MTALSKYDSVLYEKFHNDLLCISAVCMGIDPHQIDAEKNLSTYALESITFIKITAAIDEVFQINLSPASVYGHKTFGSFGRYLLDHYGAQIAACYDINGHCDKMAAALQIAKGLHSDPSKDEKTALEATGHCSGMGDSVATEGPHLILLSARNETALKYYVKSLIGASENCSEEQYPLSVLARALAFRREFFAARLALIVENMRDLNSKLKAFVSDEPNPEHVFNGVARQENNQIKLFMSQREARKVVLQWASMARNDKIAQLWTAGVPVDWKILYPQDPTSCSPLDIDLDPFIYTSNYQDRIPPLLSDAAFNGVTAVDNAKLTNAFDALERLGAQITLFLFQQFDIFTDPQTHHHPAQIKKQLAISFKFERLFNGLIYILRNNQIIDEKDNRFHLDQVYTEKTTLKLESIEQKKDTFLNQFPFFEPHIRLLWTCMTHAIAVMSEKKSAVEVIFPKMSMHLVEPVYKNNPLADYYNIVTCQVFAFYFQRRFKSTIKDKKITVLELGAGTGGTSTALFQALQPYADVVNYIYTDVSSGFVQYGKKQYSDKLPQISFKLLDIEKDVEQQEFEPDSVDIIVAANVVHATKNIKFNLMNIKKLLKKNGWIVLNEVVQFQTYSTLTFGLLDGWWLFEDEKIRIRHSPLLSYGQWKQALNDVGFSEVISLNEHLKTDAIEFQDIIVAQSDGRIF